MNPPADLYCDPDLIVWAAREVIRNRNPHAAIRLCRDIRRNAPILPAGTRDALIRELAGWLNQAAAIPLVDDRPWAAALDALRLEAAA